jgi:4'-phosphopantetheinyl transferase
MPLEVFETGDKRAWALWRISETEAELRSLADDDESVPENLSKEAKRLEWLAGRVLTQTLVENFGRHYKGMSKDAHGKPFLNGCNFHVSLSHSFPFVAVAMDKENVVGIDLEQPKEKLLRVASRVMSEEEQADAGLDVRKHCVYWCAKESLIKIHGKKDLTLAKHLAIEPFELEEEGNLVGRIIVHDRESLVPLYYRVFQSFVVVFNR